MTTAPVSSFNTTCSNWQNNESSGSGLPTSEDGFTKHNGRALKGDCPRLEIWWENGRMKLRKLLSLRSLKGTDAGGQPGPF